MPGVDAIATLSTLIHVLLNGGRLLADVSIMEAIVWQARSKFGAESRRILDKTVAAPPNEPTMSEALSQPASGADWQFQECS